MFDSLFLELHMSNRNRKLSPAVSINCFKDLEKLLGPPPILAHEDPAVYIAVGQSIWEALQPRDFIDMTWVNDVTYLLWEGLRLRRYKTKLIDATKAEGVRKLYHRISGEYREAKFWSDWALGKKEAVDLVSSLLSKSGLNSETIIAETTGIIADTLEKIERQISQSEARRLVTIRDFDQRRELLDQRQERSHQRPKKFASSTNQNTKDAPQLTLNLKKVAE